MKVLFLTLKTITDIDENNIYTDLLREFSSEGHEIFVVSPIEKRNDIEPTVIKKNGITIVRVKIGNFTKTNMIEKGLTTLTLDYIYIKAVKEHFQDIKFDLLMFSTPPISFLKTIELIKKRDGAFTYLLLKDIFPQNAIDLGILRKTGVKGLIYHYFKNQEKKLYEISDKIGCMSWANKCYVLENNDLSNDKVEICPNSIVPSSFQRLDSKTVSTIRKNYDLPQNKTIFVYGGNLGKPQGLDFVIECIKRNELSKKSFILIVGSGTEFNKLKDFFDIQKPKNAKLLGHLSKSEYDNLIRSCDVGLIFLDKKFTIPNFPSRLLHYMDVALPIIAATDLASDVGDVIVDSGCGYWCESGDTEEFTRLMNHFDNEEHRKKCGNNGRKFLEENYTARHSYEIIMDTFMNQATK